MKALVALNHEVTVVTSHGSLALPDTDQKDGVRIERFPFLATLQHNDLDRFVQICARLSILKRDFAPGVIHINLTDPSVLFHLRTGTSHLAPLLVAIRVALTQKEAGLDTLVGKALRLADWVTANSRAMLNGVLQLVPEVGPRSSVIYNGLEMPAMAPAPLPHDQPRLLCLGRLVEDKGFDLAVRALPLIRKRFSSVRLTIAGDGPAQPELRRLAAELGVGDAVDFAGWVTPETVPELLNEATVVVVPSRWEEAFGLVALQAMQMARPVVVTRVGGLPEVVHHEKTGLVVDRESPEAICGAVRELLVHPQLAADMGYAARQDARKRFSLDRYVGEHETLYQTLRSKSDVATTPTSPYQR